MILSEPARNYHTERNHQGLANRVPSEARYPRAEKIPKTGDWRAATESANL